MYDGNVWHNISILNPSAATNIYTCVTDGCPKAGSPEMRCKEGFAAGSPLCALCKKGYFRSFRDCVRCEQPRFGVMAGVVTGAFAVIVAMRFIVRRYHRCLSLTSVFAHLKVLISFVSIAATLDSQFGVVWPASFTKALDAMAVLSFDFGVMSGLVCLVDISFYSNLLCSTLALLVLVLGLLIRSLLLWRSARNDSRETTLADKGDSDELFFVVYVLLFAYPVVSVKVIDTFAW
jgi:hypothetical protein